MVVLFDFSQSPPASKCGYARKTGFLRFALATSVPSIPFGQPVAGIAPLGVAAEHSRHEFGQQCGPTDPAYGELDSIVVPAYGPPG